LHQCCLCNDRDFGTPAGRLEKCYISFASGRKGRSTLCCRASPVRRAAMVPPPTFLFLAHWGLTAVTAEFSKGRMDDHRQGNRPIHAHCCGIGRGLRCGAARVEVVQRSFPISRERCPKIEQSPIRRRASKPQSQNDSGLPQGRVGASRLRQRKAGAAFYNGAHRADPTNLARP
jgi:hypothetical protein